MDKGPVRFAMDARLASPNGQEESAIMANYFESSKSETRKFDVALANAGMTREMVNIVGNHHELGRVMVEALKGHLKDLRSELSFEGECVESRFEYPKDWGIKPIPRQIELLRKYFPGLDCSRVDDLMSRCGDLPPGMDGWVAVPKYAAVDRLLDRQSYTNWPTYNRALKQMLDVMVKARPDFLDASLGHVGPKSIEMSAMTDWVYRSSEVPGDVLILPVQTGLLHRGTSTRRARKVFQKREFGLDAYTVGCILLTHPERMKGNDVLMIRCPGTWAGKDKQSDRTACWDYDGGVFSFHICRDSEVSPLYGSASGLVPAYMRQESSSSSVA